ncbi:hypothetical protein E1B28_008615 [Marasmius oreades]|uniref:Uncharacterized protein n=1 Tax=Marasmius oreades TaxID=181124 RepID=A0A9P7RYX1_9AGAR|nr:uncharacterized protein E1B28_008615 [Marasmius oreades]KAG7092250.1 hypothetical protein E1B28_008615 [Marasmius oreades]
MTENHTHRRSSSGHSHTARSTSPPSQTFHPSILPRSVPTPCLVESVASAAHYSGARVDADTTNHRRSNSDRRSSSHLNVQEDHRKVMKDLKELYECRTTVELLKSSWHEQAIFEDPLVSCKGYDEYAAQWFGLPKLFSKSETLSTRIMSSTNSPNRLIYSQKQEYTFRYLGNKKVVNSIITVDLDESNRIIRLVEQWDGKDLPTRFGSGFLRRANAKVTPWIVRIPKN